MKKLTKAMLILALVMVAGGCAGGGKQSESTQTATSGPGPQTGLPTATVRILTAAGPAYNVTSEVATTEQQQQTGMMYRTALDEDKGMLFVFSDDQMRSFWMKNTLIPLDMIFANSSKVIVSITQNAEPQTLTGRSSDYPAKYVLEVSGGYCQRKNVQPGDTLEIQGY
jgi:uncharacterized protein